MPKVYVFLLNKNKDHYEYYGFQAPEGKCAYVAEENFSDWLIKD